MRSRSVLLSAAALCAMAGGAEARGWVVEPGAKLNVIVPYEGANVVVVRPSPTFNIRPASRPYRFTPSDGGTTFALIDNDHISFGPMARFRYRRKDDGKLTGLREVKWAAEPGAFIDFWPTYWLRTRAEARHGVGGHKGFVGDLAADLVLNRGKWSASIGPRVGYGDRDYIDEYFGVTPEEAARSPLINRPYRPKGGLRYTGVTFSGAYYLSRNWRMKWDVGYKRLSDHTGDSPIVQIAGSRDQYSGSFGISRSFSLGL
jgi:outer membrane scaffolding protein for murein synthesis (MipA/OmpV family)